MRPLTVVLALAVLTACATHTGPRLAPVDETASDPGFAAFHARLETAVAARDTEALVRLSAPDIQLGFGGAGGHADLRAWFGPDSGYWDHLASALSPGAVRAGAEAFCMPYPACLPGLVELHDPFRTVFVVEPAARLYATPDEPVRALDHDIFEVDEPREVPPGFVPVRDHDGTAGLVRRSEVRYMIDHRLHVVRGADGWRIRSFVAGD